MNKPYLNLMDKIHASSEFKENTLQKLQTYEDERRYNMKKIIIGIAASMILAIGIVAFIQEPNTSSNLDLTERIITDNSGIQACAAVNIEGIITEVGKDGLSFEINNDKWVYINDDTEIGITGPTAAPKNEQFFEPTFRVGNSIAGFSENPHNDKVVAYAIYTNWNWEDPIK